MGCAAAHGEIKLWQPSSVT